MDDQQNQPHVDPFVQEPPREPDSATVRLRAFEDEHLGKDAVRLHGDRVERGSGSLYQRLPHNKRRAHEAIEKTVETERKLNEARAVAAVAENEHRTAVEVADRAVEHISERDEAHRGLTAEERAAQIDASNQAQADGRE